MWGQRLRIDPPQPPHQPITAPSVPFIRLRCCERARDGAAPDGGEPNGGEVAQARRPGSLGDRGEVGQQLGVGGAQIHHHPVIGERLKRHSERTRGHWR